VINRLIQYVAGWFSDRPAIILSADENGDEVMQILIGQGNPGAKYAGNRHNFGFMVMDAIADEYGFTSWREKFSGLVATGEIDETKTLLLKPQTFYNETGKAGRAAMDFYKLDPSKVTVFHDEIDLAPGRLRVKFGGGHSGNNEIRSMSAHLGTDFRRVRMGVGHPGDRTRVMPYVLSNFSKDDEAWRDRLIAACVKSLPLLFKDGDERFQTEVMRLAPAPKHDPKQIP